MLLTSTLPRLCRMMTQEDKPRVKPIDLMWYDITGDSDGIEYQITDTSNSTHVKVCMQKKPKERNLATSASGLVFAHPSPWNAPHCSLKAYRNAACSEWKYMHLA
jgi:hypothetical protein